MAQVRLLYDNVTREPYFQELRTGRSFRRIVGALAWPYGDTDGCVLVLGEIRTPENVLGGRHHLFVLEEFCSHDVSRLLDTLGMLQDRFFVRRWVTPLTDNRVWMLDDYNDERRRNRYLRLSISDPQGLKGKGEGQIPFYHALIQRRTSNEKTLFLSASCTAGAAIERMDASAVTAKVIEFPSAAALFFAVAEIDLDHMPEWGERRTHTHAPADPVGGY